MTNSLPGKLIKVYISLEYVVYKPHMCIYLVFVITAIAVSTAHCRLGSCSDTHRTSEHSSQRTLFFHLFFKQTILSWPAPGLTIPFRYRFLRSDPNTCSNKALSSILNISMICNERWGERVRAFGGQPRRIPIQGGVWGYRSSDR